jgi:hypothetical protein
VVRQRLPSNTLGPVTLMGDKACVMFVSPISVLVQNLADV